MTEKQMSHGAIEALPEDASFEEIADEIRTLAAIKRGRGDIAAGRTQSHEEVKRLVESWVAE